MASMIMLYGIKGDTKFPLSIFPSESSLRKQLEVSGISSDLRSITIEGNQVKLQDAGGKLKEYLFGCTKEISELSFAPVEFGKMF